MPIKPEFAATTRSTGRRSATGSGSCAPRAAARSAAGRMARWCATWATAAGGTSSGRLGGTAEAAGSPRLPWSRMLPVRTTRVVLAAAHLDHDPAHCGHRHRNVRALCQRCHLLHDRPEHRRRIRLTLRRRRALGDLFSGPLPFLVRSRQRRPPQLRHDPSQTHGQPARIGRRTADPGASLRQRRPSCGPRRDVTGCRLGGRRFGRCGSGRLAAEADLLGQRRALRGVGRRHHRVVLGQAPARRYSSGVML